MVGLLRTILILVLVYYAIRFITRLLVPFILKRVFRNYQQQSSGNSGDDQQKKSSGRKKDDTLGEYVDYEEVE